MYRRRVMFPWSADPSLVHELVERAAAEYKRNPRRSVMTSVDALMGPSARTDIGGALEADLDTLEASSTNTAKS